MTTVFSWSISQLECYPRHEGRDNVVFIIHWRRNAVDGEHIADCFGTQTITLDPDASFTPFADLTKTQVEEWLESAMGKDKISELDADLSEQLRNLKNPSVVRPVQLPWN